MNVGRTVSPTVRTLTLRPICFHTRDAEDTEKNKSVKPWKCFEDSKQIEEGTGEHLSRPSAAAGDCSVWIPTFAGMTGLAKV
ncbi:MAG: hypothetical protein JXB30_14795 [Anaerolineae bacterium]|nr:hypothetical protein [Anaerolineae bacterium]